MNRHMICKPLCKSSENQHNQRPPIPTSTGIPPCCFSTAKISSLLCIQVEVPQMLLGFSTPWCFGITENPIAQPGWAAGSADKFAKARHHSQHRNLDCCIVAKCNSLSLGHFETLFDSTHLGQNWQPTNIKRNKTWCLPKAVCAHELISFRC